MNQSQDNLKLELQNSVTAYVKESFLITSYTESPEDEKIQGYHVYGTIERNGKPLKIKASVRKNSLRTWDWKIADENYIMPVRETGEVTLSKNVVISDPSYDRDAEYHTKTNVKPGIWKTYAAIDKIDVWGTRLWLLELWHKDFVHSDKPEWKEISSLGVDSAMMSVIDSAYFYKRNRDKSQAFLDKCYELTDGENKCGIFVENNVNVGIVCSSGVGDGGYPLYTIETGDEIIAIKINFDC